MRSPALPQLLARRDDGDEVQPSLEIVYLHEHLRAYDASQSSYPGLPGSRPLNSPGWQANAAFAVITHSRSLRSAAL